MWFRPSLITNKTTSSPSNPPFSYLARQEVRVDVASEMLDGSFFEIVGDEIRENPADSTQAQFARDFSDDFLVRVFL